MRFCPEGGHPAAAAGNESRNLAGGNDWRLPHRHLRPFTDGRKVLPMTDNLLLAVCAILVG